MICVNLITARDRRVLYCRRWNEKNGTARRQSPHVVAYQKAYFSKVTKIKNVRPLTQEQAKKRRLRGRERYKAEGRTEAYKTAHRNAALRRKYGISINDWNAALALQHNCCAICGQEFTAAMPPNVDHSHKTGKFRGLLCRAHNVGLGHFSDSVDLLRKASLYLEQAKEGTNEVNDQAVSIGA